MTDSLTLLAQYVESGSEAAFRELVTRYVNLVYSAARRLVNGDAHLAEDVTQTVFVDLARQARGLSRDVKLGGWLHRHTCYVASKILRSERRRLARERQAVEMNASEDHSAASLASVAALLDDAINQLGSEDRAAILLRFFEQRDFRSVGEALGSSEEAARKRVERALGKLELSLRRRGVAFSAAALGTALATQAVSAAPAGLAMSISSAALASAATGGGTALTVFKIMSMTKLKIGIISAVVVAGVAIPVAMHQRTQAKLRAADEAMRQQAEQVNALAAENERLAQAAVQESSAPAPATGPSPELLRLRGEVGRLRQENAVAAQAAARRTNAPSVLSGITANPEMMKMIRNQNKLALGQAYKDLAAKLKLTPEQTGEFNDLLAENAVGCIEPVTDILRTGKSSDEVNRIFDQRDAEFLEKVRTLLGPEGLSEYQTYSRDLTSTLTARQFEPQMTGDSEAKQVKSQQLAQLMREETQAALIAAGLSADYQTAPMLNFRNLASEELAERSLTLLDGIYERVAARADTFLSADELKKFGEFRTTAITQNRMALTLNRKVMAPAQ